MKKQTGVRTNITDQRKAIMTVDPTILPEMVEQFLGFKAQESLQ